MSVKFFGQFLLERGVLNAKQLLEAIKYQESKNLKFGEYAQEKGYLKVEQVKKIQEEQKRSDMRIGELAVELGFLTDGQVDEILTMQKNDHVMIGQAIVAKGLMRDDALDVELKAFRADQSVYDIDEIKVPDGLKQPEFIRIMADVSLKMLRRVAQAEAKLDDGVMLDVEPQEQFCAVTITFSGGVNYDYVLLADRPAAEMMATSVIGQSVTDESDAMVFDGVREFTNIICGNILAKMAQKGKNVEISIPHTPQYDGGYNLFDGRKAVKYTLATTVGDISLVMVEM